MVAAEERLSSVSFCLPGEPLMVLLNSEPLALLFTHSCLQVFVRAKGRLSTFRISTHRTFITLWSFCNPKWFMQTNRGGVMGRKRRNEKRLYMVGKWLIFLVSDSFTDMFYLAVPGLCEGGVDVSFWPEKVTGRPQMGASTVHRRGEQHSLEGELLRQNMENLFQLYFYCFMYSLIFSY